MWTFMIDAPITTPTYSDRRSDRSCGHKSHWWKWSATALENSQFGARLSGFGRIGVPRSTPAIRSRLRDTPGEGMAMRVDADADADADVGRS